MKEWKTMRCPNCRCVIPGSMRFCSYCGYRFRDGSAPTLSVTEAYSDRQYQGSAYYARRGYSQELTAEPYTAYSYRRQEADNTEPYSFPMELVMVVLLGLCAVFMLIIMALLVLIV